MRSPSSPSCSCRGRLGRHPSTNTRAHIMGFKPILSRQNNPLKKHITRMVATALLSATSRKTVRMRGVWLSFCTHCARLNGREKWELGLIAWL